MKEIFQKLKGGLIVSCQAEGDSPFNSPEGVTMFAKAAQSAGAAGIRSEGIDKTRAIIKNIGLPVIGLVKSKFENGYVRITGSFKDVEELLSIGVDIIAVDGTFRKREGKTGPEFISALKGKHDCIVMADISSFDEGIACAEAGADCVSSTLSGYTPDSNNNGKDAPDFDLVRKLSSSLKIPVFAEGRINSPEMAVKMKQSGAWSIVVGSAITRPSIITGWYVDALSKNN